MNLPAQSLPDVELDEPEPRKREFSSPFAFVGVVIVGALVVVACILGTTEYLAGTNGRTWLRGIGN